MLQESVLDRARFDVKQDLELLDKVLEDDSNQAGKLLATLNYVLIATRDDTSKPTVLQSKVGPNLRAGTKEFLESAELYLMGDFVEAEQRIHDSQKKGMDRGFCLLVLTFIAKAQGNQTLVNSCIQWIAREPTLKHCRPILSQLMNERNEQELIPITSILDSMNNYGNHGASGLISLGRSAEELLDAKLLEKEVEFILVGLSAKDKSVFQRSLAGQDRKQSMMNLAFRMMLAENAYVFESVVSTTSK